MAIKAVFFDIDSLLANQATAAKPAKLRKEVLDLLKSLKNLDLKLVLIANNSFPDKESLARLKILSYFDLTVYKPVFGVSNPLFLYQAFISLASGIGSGESVYVSEQFDGNLKIAGRAGMWLIWLNRQKKKRELPFGWQVESINEVLGVVVKNIKKIEL